MKRVLRTILLSSCVAAAVAFGGIHQDGGTQSTRAQQGPNPNDLLRAFIQGGSSQDSDCDSLFGGLATGGTGNGSSGSSGASSSGSSGASSSGSSGASSSGSSGASSSGGSGSGDGGMSLAAFSVAPHAAPGGIGSNCRNIRG